MSDFKYVGKLHNFESKDELFHRFSNEDELIKTIKMFEHEIKTNPFVLPSILSKAELKAFIDYANNGWDGTIPHITDPVRFF